MTNDMFGIDYFALSGLDATLLLKGGLHPPLRYIAPLGLFGDTLLLKGGLHPPLSYNAPLGLWSILALKGHPIIKKGYALRIRVKAQKALKGRN